MNEKTVTVSWYNCECEWLSDYCDENHRVYATVPVSVLKEYAK